MNLTIEQRHELKEQIAVMLYGFDGDFGTDKDAAIRTYLNSALFNRKVNALFSLIINWTERSNEAAIKAERERCLQICVDFGAMYCARAIRESE